MPSRARHRISSSPVETPPSPPSPRFFRRRWLIEGPTTHTKRRKFVFIGYVLGRACNKPARQTASHSHRRRWRWLSLSPTTAQLRHQKLRDLRRKLCDLHWIVRELNLLRILCCFLLSIFPSVFSCDGPRFMQKLRRSSSRLRLPVFSSRRRPCDCA
ncbi:hypothetical protein TIFTF001_048953 [Ficus carica]|uniref:Uncharacterized protein n=1 Tax=Ficus carica TaxID=3494 RepID=A0AA87YYE7_FICCA|nr:hypothetical protein TIFTF001_048950 [Ficus carica]GMN22009.1 hypothetical protein TIFTF001_048953 [Ficus carica]